MGAGLTDTLCNPLTADSGAKHLAAATTASRQYAATVLGGHTGAEAMDFAALTLLGLIGTEHDDTLLIQNNGEFIRAPVYRNAGHHKTTIVVY